jgi:hypothetical protein
MEASAMGTATRSEDALGGKVAVLEVVDALSMVGSELALYPVF